MHQAGRANCKLLAVDAGACDGEREENVRVADCVVIEVVGGTLAKAVHVEAPASQRNGETNLVFFVAFAFERDDPKALRDSVVEQRSRHG